jgi:glycosyltransferase involved in cell wall biosynthesis
VKLGMICRADKSGLGQGQTLRLARLLKPDKIMLIDSTPFNGAQQFPEWYAGYDCMPITGFPTNDQIIDFVKHIDVLLSCETFYSNSLTRIAKMYGVRTILCANYEFLDYLKPEYSHIFLPDRVITPSYWHLDELKQRFNAEYIPTPIFDDEFKEAREINFKRTGQRKYLFMNGKTAIHDRNGLESLYAALELSKGDFTVTIKAQHDVKKHPDPRLIYDFSNPDNQADLYKDFDALILPRRYGGQSLPMCEALMSGLPVIMTDIDPNNKVLPSEWLVPAVKTGEFMTRTIIDIYSASPNALAYMLDNIYIGPKTKDYACYLGKEFEAETLRPKYEELTQ